MTKRRQQMRPRRTLGLSSRVLFGKQASQNAGLQKPKLRTLDREMQGLEFNRRVEQGNVGINTVDATRLDWQSSGIKNVVDNRTGFEGVKGIGGTYNDRRPR